METDIKRIILELIEKDKDFRKELVYNLIEDIQEQLEEIRRSRENY